MAMPNLQVYEGAKIGTGDVANPQAFAQLNAKLAQRQNSAAIWPGRIDPCNMSQPLDLALQSLVEQLVNQGLTDAQQQQAKVDLAMIALRCFVEGRVGFGRGLKAGVQGHWIELDGVDLTCMLKQLGDQPLTPVCIHHAMQQHHQHLQAPQPVELCNPELLVKQGFKVQSPMYGDMQQIMRAAPVRPFGPQQQVLARQVLDLMPVAAQGKLHKVPAELIGRYEFVNVMQAAAHAKQLPEPLQKFRDSCLNNDAMKKAIYKDPHIAARVLGMPSPLVCEPRPSASLAKEIAAHVMDQASPTQSAWGAAGRFMQWVAAPLQTTGEQLAREAFAKLGNYAGFALQDSADVPMRFNNIECPEASCVKHCSAGPLNVHANRVSLGQGRQAVAATPPWVDEGKTKAESDFLKMIAGDAPSTVFDLRSSNDFHHGEFNYCPPLGETRQVEDPQTGKHMVVKTLQAHDIPGENCRALVLEVALHGQAPKQVRVLQFLGWPDHGVIAPAALRGLRQLMDTQLEEGLRVITHCRAGVGRTGTLLAYAHLHHNLIALGQGKHMVDAKGRVDNRALVTAIAEAVAQGRIERGASFVQSKAQFLLLYHTLKEDLKMHKVADAPQAVVTPAAPRRLGLGVHAASNFCAEPPNEAEGLQHWIKILDQGEDVVEMVGTPSRMLGREQRKAPGAPQHKGLGVALGALLPKDGGSQTVMVGQHHVAITPIPLERSECEGGLVEAQRFKITYRRPGEQKNRVLFFTQLLTPYDGKKLTADQLSESLDVLQEAGHLKPKWLTSVRGVGRPSALWVAQAMRIEIARGHVKDEAQLAALLDTWIEHGKKALGPLFINTRAQRQALMEFGAREMLGA
ncbi:MAG TPA: protein-tyrosine phosphatase family protein [Limnobacter sp.]|nr:protein-tyrosine phosphatase family protein [Limnobacter sp.]